MNSFERIRVRGFRRLLNLDLELRPLCVLIGANSSGKTSLLDVFSLLAASASGKLGEKISDMEGLGANLTIDRAKEMSLELSMARTRLVNPRSYRLVLSPRAVGYEIREEILTEQQSAPQEPLVHIERQLDDVRYYQAAEAGITRPSRHHNLLETALAQVPNIFQEPEDFRQRLASSTHYHALNVTPRAPVRLPQPLRPAPLPGRDGENLVSCLFSLRETDRDRFSSIEDTLRAAFPGFQRLDFPPVAAGTLAMTWKDGNFSVPLYVHQLSEGTLRFLWLVTLLQSPGLTAVTMIDEPEVSLHPELLNLLAGVLREASARTQLIVATHADRLVRFLEPNEVVALDLAEDGTTQATWADQLDLEQWLDEYTLDEVWRLGRMGARA
jgi:predicted ATPase